MQTVPETDHLFRLIELYPGHRDTRVLLCDRCGWASDSALALEDLDVPACETE